ncbi:MAG: WD40 repeat domain-containing serine/threonine-protein kinase [Phycisphaerales bacterium]
MSDDLLRRAEAIFFELSEAAAAERAPLLAARCGGDAALTAEVQSLLSHLTGSDGFLNDVEQVAANLGLVGHGSLDDSSLKPGQRFAEYTIERPIGVGGMGAVYVARQERPNRTVALKVIRPGLASQALARRFEHEAELLGRLQHPGIAQIYAAGVATTPTGPRPYIAMELVDGQSLTDYADARMLSVPDRLMLIARVCEAVHHAHQRGIIHRDLKPANILVTESGEPKILDFGVARAADADLQVTTLQTSVGQLVGTLPYMSPEQVVGDPREIDTRSDVYALGVLLYQVLTGRLPHDLASRSIPEAARVIRDEAPASLSSISRTFRGAIDAIVSKAIEKDKQRRYQSAADLADDIRRFLAGEPVMARGGSAVYTLRVHLRRHRGLVAAASLFLIGLLGFTIYASISARSYKALATSESEARREAFLERQKSDLFSEELRRRLVEANIGRGRLEGAEGNLAIAEDYLWRQWLEDPRSIEARWALAELYSRSPSLWTSRPMANSVRATASADGPAGPVLAVAGDDRAVCFLNPSTGQVLRRLPPLPAQVAAIGWSPDACSLAVGLNDGSIHVFPEGGDSASLVIPRAHDGACSTIAFSTDRRLLASSGADGYIRLWRPSERRPFREWLAHSGGVRSIAFSADSSRLASAPRGEVDTRPVVWAVPSGVCLAKAVANESLITALALSPDGRSVATAGYDRRVLITNVDTGESRQMFGARNEMGSALRFSNDGKRLIGACGFRVYIWEAISTDTLAVLGSYTSTIMSLTPLPDGSIVGAESAGTIRRWMTDELPGAAIHGGFTNWTFGVDFCSIKPLLAVGGGAGLVSIVDASRATRLIDFQTDRARTRGVRFLPASTQLVTGDNLGRLRILDAETGKVVRATTISPNAEIMSMAVSRDASRIAAAFASERVVRVLDSATFSVLASSQQFARRPEGVAFDPSETYVAASGHESGIQILDARTLQPVASLLGTGQAWPVAFSPDGSLVAAGTWDATIDLWDTRTWERVGTLVGHGTLVPGLAFSPDGRILASSGSDARVKLWDVASRACLLSIDARSGECPGIAFNPAGDHLAVACQSGRAIIWNLATFDRCIDGNMEYQLQRIGTDAPPDRAAALRDWSRRAVRPQGLVMPLKTGE